MSRSDDRATVPWRWRLAGRLRRLPEFKGRDRLGSLILGGAPPPVGVHRGVFGPGLRYEARYGDDGSLAELFFLQYEEPSLVPVLQASLTRGSVFFDVGANIGVYSGWGSRLVGAQGAVHAFEPVPATRAMLTRFVELNGLANVTVVPRAVGRGPGTIEIHVPARASGRASAVQSHGSAGAKVSAPMTSLDDYVLESRSGTPQLVKIDVEGYEFEVIRGARAVLSTPSPPAVLFESQELHESEAGASFSEIVRWFDAEVGFRVYAMLPCGLVLVDRSESTPRSTNSLALHPSAHEREFGLLRRRRFRRNQTC